MAEKKKQTKQEQTVELAVEAMMAIVRMARKPIVRHRGAMLIEEFRARVKLLK